MRFPIQVRQGLASIVHLIGAACLLAVPLQKPAPTPKPAIRMSTKAPDPASKVADLVEQFRKISGGKDFASRKELAQFFGMESTWQDTQETKQDVRPGRVDLANPAKGAGAHVLRPDFQMFNALDVNCDGYISIYEFKEWAYDAATEAATLEMWVQFLAPGQREAFWAKQEFDSTILMCNPSPRNLMAYVNRFKQGRCHKQRARYIGPPKR